MELDSRIIEGKKPLNCFDTEQAWQFIGKRCYFSDDARDFMNLDKADGDTLFYVAVLQNIWTAEEYCFADNSNDYRFILPLEWVKPEKKRRAYTIAEFQETFTVGKAVRFRRKDEPTKEHLLAFGGYYTLHDGRVSILFGIHLYTLEELFEQYEWQEFYTDEYRPFGIEE